MVRSVNHKSMSKTFGFSVLSNDVDLDDRLLKRPSKDKAAKAEPEPVRKPIVKPNQKTLKKKHEKESLQALAFGKPATKKKAANAPVPTKTNNSSSKKIKSNGTVCNGVGQHDKEKPLPEDWKNRDQQFVEEENERELREALMLSKLDYEANKDLYQHPDLTSALAKAKKKKKDKPITISLSEFNTLDSKKLSNLNSNGIDINSSLAGKQVRKSSSGDDNFFVDVDQAVRTTIIKENRQKQYTELSEKQKATKKQQQKSTLNGGSQGPSSGGVLVPIAEVEKRDFEIQALRLEVEDLRGTLEKVKIRNKKLCEVLGTAEMRQVGEVVVELEKVRRARDEFSAEVTTLSEQLEQEKTKVSQLQDKCRKK